MDGHRHMATRKGLMFLGIFSVLLMAPCGGAGAAGPGVPSSPSVKEDPMFELGLKAASEEGRQRFPVPKTRVLNLSLKDAVEIAVNNNDNVLLLQEQIREAESAAMTQLGALLPNVSGTYSATRRTFFLGTFGISPRVAGPFNFYDGRGTLTQNVFSLSLIKRWRAARMNTSVAELDSRVTKQDTMATVALFYMEALRTEAAVEAREANVQLNKELLRLALNRKRAGMATALDVTRQKVQLENERQRLLVARNERERSKLNLIRAMGITFDVALKLTDELALSDAPLQSPEQALAVAHQHRVELQAQARRKQLASMTLSSITSERIPSLSFEGDYGLIGLHVNETFATWNGALALSIPVFDGGQREGRISESRSQVRQEQIRMNNISKQVSLEVRDALITLESARQQVTVARGGLRLALEEVDLAKERFSVGVATSIEISDAQTSVAQARDNVIEALFSFNTARVNLARAQGRIQDLY